MRIFTTRIELPFASHPTVGSAPGWSLAENPAELVELCGPELVRVRRDGSRLASLHRYRAGAHHTSHPQGTVLGRARLGLRSKVVSEIWTGGDSVTGLSGRFTFSDSPW